MKLSLQSGARFVDLIVDLIIKKCEKPVIFFRFLCQIELSLQSRAHLVRLIFKKCRKPLSFLRFLYEIELLLESRAHFVGHFPDRGAHPRKQRPSSGDHWRPLNPKKTQGFVPESVFSREFTRSRSPTWWLTVSHDEWHDDVVDTMMWLTWWCDRWLWESFANRKFPN